MSAIPARTRRAYFDALPSCTRRAIEHSLMRQLEERTLQPSQRKLAQESKQVQRAVR